VFWAQGMEEINIESKHTQADDAVTDLQLPYRFILYISHFIYDTKMLYYPDPSNIFLRDYFMKQYPPLRTYLH
jgi:hypothetical protein